MQIVCPSGFAGEARKIRAADLHELADRLDEDMEATDIGLRFISACWQRTTDVGPYSFLSEGVTTPDWTRVLKGDILGILFQLRIGSFKDGQKYAFPVKCEECGKRFDRDWEVDLGKDVLERVKPLPETSREAVRAGTPLFATLADGTKVAFALPTPGDEPAHAKVRKQLVGARLRRTAEVNLLDQVAMRVRSVEGKPGLDAKRIWLWLKDLDLDELLSLDAQMDQADCGYETTIGVRCDKPPCRWSFEVALPLVKSFFAPPRTPTSPAGSPTESTGSEEDGLSATRASVS